MNVLVISQMYPNSENEISGIFVHEQLLALREQGVMAKVISAQPWTPFYFQILPGRWGKIADIPSGDVKDSIEVFYPRYFSIPRNLLLSTIGHRLYHGIRQKAIELKRIFDFDIIHAHAVIPAGYAAMLLSKELNVPYVVTVHGSDFFNTIHRSKKLKDQVEEVIKKSSKTITVSDVLKRTGKKALQGRLPIVTVRNGIAAERVIAEAAEIKKIPDEKILLSVANLIERKGIQQVILALKGLLKQHEKVRYLVIGDGLYRPALESLVDELDLGQYVDFLGQKSHRETMRYMAACDVFVLPSWDEAFGVVYIEAMANGKPVIGCVGEGIEDFVMDKESGFLVKPKDINSLGSILEYILEHPGEIAEIGRRAQKHILENFTWEKNAQDMVRIYQESLHQSSQSQNLHI
jgi:glycosyltransferase involved in cell wall biosynthesis